MPSPEAIFVDTTLSTFTGGAQIFLGRLLPALRERGWHVTVVTQGGGRSGVVEDLRRAGIDVQDRLWPAPSLVEDAAGVLARWANARQPAVFVVSVSEGIGWAALPLLSGRVATSAIVHSDSETFYRPVRHYGRVLTLAVGVSDLICARMQESAGMPPARVRRIPYGVPSPAREPKRGDGALEVVYVARLEQAQKRVSDLVAIVRRLTDPAIRFRVIGDGPERAALRQALAPQVDRGQVRFEGWLDQNAVSEHLSRADVLLLTSASEGLPIVVIEALAHGVVPVVTDIPGCRELVRDGESGFLVTLGSIRDFAGRLLALKQDPGLRARLGAEASRAGRRYSISRMADEYDRCLRDAVVVNREARGNGRPIEGYPLMSSCLSPYPTPLRRLVARMRRQLRTVGR